MSVYMHVELVIPNIFKGLTADAADQDTRDHSQSDLFWRFRP